MHNISHVDNHCEATIPTKHFKLCTYEEEKLHHSYLLLIQGVTLAYEELSFGALLLRYPRLYLLY